jgi:hypothetical protein
MMMPFICSYRNKNGDMGGHALRETTSRGLCGLGCPSSTSERGGEGDCVKGGGFLCLLLQYLIQFSCVCVCLLRHHHLTAVPNTKLCAWGTEDSGGHVI